jgi:hypothetical protein
MSMNDDGTERGTRSPDQSPAGTGFIHGIDDFESTATLIRQALHESELLQQELRLAFDEVAETAIRIAETVGMLEDLRLLGNHAASTRRCHTRER